MKNIEAITRVFKAGVIFTALGATGMAGAVIDWMPFYTTIAVTGVFLLAAAVITYKFGGEDDK